MKPVKNKAKTSSQIINILKGSVVIGLLIALIYVNMTRPRILILHSYAEDFSWVTNFNAAFKSTLKHPSNPVIYYNYMNTLKKQSLRYKNRAGQEAIQMIKATNPDIILPIFTDATEFAAQKYVNHPHIKIVYNMKSDPTKFQYDTAKNVQGVKAAPALKDLNELLLVATSKRPIRIAHIGDQSASVRLYDKYIVNHAWENIILVDSILVDNFPDWQKAIQVLADQVDYIIVSKYFGFTEAEDAKSDTVSTKEVMKWTMENSKVPIIGLYTAVVIDGADISIEDSPFEQGEIMAKMTMNLIDKKPVEPKMQEIQHFITTQNAHSRVHLPEVYNSFATALNESKNKS